MAELMNQSQTSERQNIQDTSNFAPSSLKRVLNNIERGNEVPVKRRKTDYASGLKSSLHGTIYQLKLLMLCLERGLKLNYIFNLETESTEAGEFDDLVLSYKLEGEEKIKYLFLQAKDKHNEEKDPIKASDLLSVNMIKPFSLQKYFISYKNIQKNSRFANASVELKDFIIYTNNEFNKENFKLKDITLKPVVVNDPLLNMTTMGKEAKQYKLEVSSDHNLFKILKKTSDAHLLASALAKYTYDSIKLTLKPSIFEKYHAALAKDVIDINTRKFRCGFFKKQITLDSSTASFRKLFVKEIRTLHSRYKNEKIWKNDDLIKYLEGKQLEISSEFGKNIPEQSLPIDIITENEVKEFLDKLVFAVNQPNEIELDEIIQKELGFQLNLRNSEFVYGLFQTKIMDWFKEYTNKPLSEIDVKETINKIKCKLNTLVVTGISLQHCESIDKYGLSFENKFLELNNFLKGSDGKQIFHLVTKEEATVISSVRVYNTIKESRMYDQVDSHIFMPVKDLSNKKAQTRVLNAYRANRSHDLLVIDNESEDITVDLRNLCSKLLETISGNPSKKLIIISISNANLASIFSDGSKYEEVNNSCSFIDLSDNSLKTVLKNFEDELTKEANDLEKDKKKIVLLMLSIQRIDLESGSEYIHRTFAEYFSSYLLCNYLGKRRSNPKYQHTKIFILESIFKKRNSVIFNFMNHRLYTNTEWMSILTSNLLFNSKEIQGKLEYESQRLQAPIKSLRDLQNMVEGSFNSYGGRSTLLINKLYSKFFTVTDVGELKATLTFLLKAHKKCENSLANKAIQRSITEAALHYLNYAKQNQATCDDNLNFFLESLGDSCKLIFNFYLNKYKFDDILVEMGKLFNSKNLLKYPGNLKWLEREGLGISKRLKILTPIMAEIFISVIDGSRVTGYESYYASNIFDYLILPLLTATHIEKNIPNVDKLSLVDMFQNFAQFVSTTSRLGFSTINIEQLGALLDSIKPFLEKRELNEKEMSITIKCLITLKLWNINLIDFEQKLLIQDADGNFCYEFSLINKDEIVEQIRLEIDKSRRR